MAVHFMDTALTVSVDRNVCLFPKLPLNSLSELHPLLHRADPIQAALFLISDHLSQWTPTLEAALRLFAQNTIFQARKCSVMNNIRNVHVFIYLYFCTVCQL